MVLDRLSSQAGHWHELARLLPGLAASGYDGAAIEERCGIERATQGRWVISLSVRAPCCASSPSRLVFFQNPQGAGHATRAW